MRMRMSPFFSPLLLLDRLGEGLNFVGKAFPFGRFAPMADIHATHRPLEWRCWLLQDIDAAEGTQRAPPFVQRKKNCP